MTDDITLIPDGGISWLDASGPEGNIVLSTRIRLARNLEGRSFPIRADSEVRLATLDRVVDAALSCGGMGDAAVIRFDAVDAEFCALLHERHLVSKELVSSGRDGRKPAGAALVTDGEAGNAQCSGMTFAVVGPGCKTRDQVLREGQAPLVRDLVLTGLVGVDPIPLRI